MGSFKDHHNCAECTGAGWGWCSRVRKCGGFANKVCSGGITDTERSVQDQAAWIAKRYPNQKAQLKTKTGLSPTLNHDFHN